MAARRMPMRWPVALNSPDVTLASASYTGAGRRPARNRASTVPGPASIRRCRCGGRRRRATVRLRRRDARPRRRR
jgi:hypothetical protein